MDIQHQTPGGDGVDDDSALTDSAIFSVTTLVGGDLLDTPSIDLGATRMDESQLRLAASVFSNTRDGILITDANARILDINRAFTRMTGYVREDLIGRHIGVLRADDHPHEFYEEMKLRLKNRGFWRGEAMTRRKNGEVSADLLTVCAVLDAFGELTHYVSIYTDISEIRESQQRLEHLAYHDALTHLPNRTLLADRIEQALTHAKRHQRLLAVCLLDLDDFKPINDTHGHQIGNALLIEVARRLKQMVRAGDTVARLGGDEFALLLTDLSGPEMASEILERLLASVSEPYVLGGVSMEVSASIGYTLAPRDESDSDTLLRHADQAMYVAKLEGRNRCHQFDAESDRRIRSHRESVGRIEQAIVAGELRLFYQPKADLRTGAVVGAEALIRWQHPEKGLLGPVDFVLPLSDHPIQVDIGEWVMNEALRQMSAWLDKGLRLPVSINVAGSHLVQPNFVDRLRECLARYPRVDPSCLELEILETVALEDITLVSDIIDRCRALGVQFALDDFGTGYSSLVYLKRLPASTLKIDRSFVRDMIDDPEDLAIVSGIVGLASAFRRTPVAEGVETVAHGVLLLDIGCDVAQGYGIARPMPPSDLVGWVTAFKPEMAWLDSLARPWQRVDFPVLVAMIDYEGLLAALNRDMGGAPTRLAPVGNARENRFSHWLSAASASRYGDLPVLRDIDETHRQVLRLRVEMAVRQARGDRSRDGELCAQLRQRVEVMMPKLRILRDAVAGTLPL